jgi:hypothetical protein
MKRVPGAGTITQETQIVFERVAARLAAAGLGLGDVVKTTCYLRDESYREEFAQAYRDVFAPGLYPARCTDEALACRPDVIINAAGLAAGGLVGDGTTYPIRGQIVRVTNPGLAMSVRDEGHPACFRSRLSTTTGTVGPA